MLGTLVSMKPCMAVLEGVLAWVTISIKYISGSSGYPFLIDTILLKENVRRDLTKSRSEGYLASTKQMSLGVDFLPLTVA